AFAPSAYRISLSPSATLSLCTVILSSRHISFCAVGRGFTSRRAAMPFCTVVLSTQGKQV
ncbi:MAG: hypothetical protein MJ078_02140, partial [Clostridia bacterium]|nr:hypothetical protein [Clostridia bacterium]